MTGGRRKRSVCHAASPFPCGHAPNPAHERPSPSTSPQPHHPWRLPTALRWARAWRAGERGPQGHCRRPCDGVETQHTKEREGFPHAPHALLHGHAPPHHPLHPPYHYEEKKTDDEPCAPAGRARHCGDPARPGLPSLLHDMMAPRTHPPPSSLPPPSHSPPTAGHHTPQASTPPRGRGEEGSRSSSSSSRRRQKKRGGTKARSSQPSPNQDEQAAAGPAVSN